MKTVITIIILIIIIALLIWWVATLIKKNGEIKKENKALKEQLSRRADLERKTYEDISKMHTGDDAADAAASLELMQELSQKRRK